MATIDSRDSAAKFVNSVYKLTFLSINALTFRQPYKWIIQQAIDLSLLINGFNSSMVAEITS